MGRFDAEAEARQEFEAKFKALVEERFSGIMHEIRKEGRLREQSVSGLEKHIDGDFQRLEEELKAN